MAVGFPVKANYATGDVLTATNMNDLSGSVNLLQTSQYGAGRNVLINGGYDIWQRGTSFSIAASTANTYTTDRWSATFNGAGTAGVISRQATGDTTNLSTIQYCARVQRNSGQTGTGGQYFAQSMETSNAIAFAGKTVVLSFYARKGANYSPASNLLNANLWTGTGTDGNILTGGSFVGAVQQINQNATLTATWQRFSYSVTLPADATQLAVSFLANHTGTAGTNDYYEVTGVQLELGSVATTFSRNGSTYQGELAACQRYYWRTSNTTTYAVHGQGSAYSTTAALINVINPVPLRVAATSVDYGNLRLDDNSAGFALTTVALNSIVASTTLTNVQVTGSSGLTQYRFYNLSNNNNTAGYIGFSAEL